MVKRITVCLAFVFLLQLGALFPVQTEIQNLRTEISELSGEIAEAEHRYSHLEEDVSAFDDRFAGVRQEIDTLLEMTSAHENCVALALQMNAASVTAKMYDRTADSQENLYADDASFAAYYGRLYIPDAKIDVALYSSHKQSVTDRADSANIFTWGTYSGENIADHSNQEFAKLFSVTVGMQGYIQLPGGDIVNIECVEVFDGHNVGKDITDNDGVSAMGRADYMMYTCRNGWQNVRICLWDKF